jgi:DNA-binding Lrp family transcriptional regulator
MLIEAFVEKFSVVVMDKKDCMIYKMLREDGRVKLTELAKKLDLSPSSTKERLEKLLGRGDVKVRALLNVRKRGWKFAVCNIEAKNMEEAMKLADAFKKCPRVVFAMTMTGSYNLLLIIAGRTTTLLENTIENDIRPMPGIKRMEISIGEAPIVPEFIDVDIPERFDKPPCGTKPCIECYLYEKKCEGCPATDFWLGLDCCPF